MSAIVLWTACSLRAADGLTNWVAVINEFNLQFKVFNASDEGGSAALGFSYDFDKSLINKTLLDGSADKVALSVNVEADGNIAFNNNQNPENLLTTGGYLQFQHAHKFGVSDTNRLTHPLLYTLLTARARMESDQKFETRQGAYGVLLGVQPLDLERQSFYWLNILDYPFAATRYLTSPDNEFAVEGDFPTFLVGFDLIDPDADDARFAIDPDGSSYNRFSAEVAFTTTVATIKDESLKFGAAYRYFKELSPSDAIRQADFDEQNYFVAYLEYKNFVFSYSTGELPVDRENDRVFAIGYRLQF
jgi:hypothetical protein